MIVACLSYYAETVETLDRCVSSLAGVCSGVVALQGRWDFPKVSRDDPEAQQEALFQAARGAGLTYEHGAGLWASQVEKRSQLMAWAALHGEWLFVIDADEWLEAADGPALRAGLEQTDRDVAQVMCRRHPLDASSFPRPIRRIYRASTGVQVVIAHNGYVTADGRFLHGDPAYVELAEPVDLSAHVVLGHDTSARSGERAKARKEFLYERRRLRTESWAMAHA